MKIYFLVVSNVVRRKNVVKNTKPRGMLVKNALKWDTKLCIGLILLCHLFDSACFSQFGQNKSSEYSSSHSIFFSQSYQKFDNFSSLNWSLRKNNLSISSAFGVGINR
ncbi:MAG: hypothetical protein ACKO6A_08275, partial [Bacteroidota bacterium]